jgi:hypothetical protein
MTEKSGRYAGVRSLLGREKAKNGDQESRVYYITASEKKVRNFGSFESERTSKISQR